MSLHQAEFWSCEPESGGKSDLSVTAENILWKESTCKDLFLVLAEQRRGKEPSSLRRGFGTASMSGIEFNSLQLKKTKLFKV